VCARQGTPHSLSPNPSTSSAMKTLQHTDEDLADPESADQGDTGAATKYFLCESRSKCVTSDNPEYSVNQHLCGF